MKYIRTKDGIHENMSTNAYIRDIGAAKVIVKHINKETLEESFEFRMCRIRDILKQADTIEELCDCFVYIRHDKPHYPPKVVKDLGALRENRWCDVFGAIWTNKGLIYVAKLNDEGDLELL